MHPTAAFCASKITGRAREDTVVSEIVSCSRLRSASPILEGYTADPHAAVFDDTYYVYPTSDKEQWQTTDFSCWSSKDLILWKNEGMILDVTKDLKWAKIRAWAPAMIRRDGKYYFYFCAEQQIGVAVSDKPTGRFVDALEKPLLTGVSLKKAISYQFQGSELPPRGKTHAGFPNPGKAGPKR